LALISIIWKNMWLFSSAFPDRWQKRWVQSQYKSDYGKFRLSPGTTFGDRQKDTGLQTSQSSRYYALSARFKPFSNVGETLVIQFTAKHEQAIDCGGGYIKLFPAGLNQATMNGESTYYIMGHGGILRHVM
uniref:Calreticulin n=1 Tax=Sphenodon punctatus TaxID=8508 RepID=A0A8D0H4X5_SPHPU